MSHIANTIDTLIRNSNPQITGMDLARATGIQMAQISRIRNGHQIWVNPKDLHKISEALCKGNSSTQMAQVHAQLLYARLLDERSGPGASLIDIKLQTEEVAPASKPKPVLPPSLQQNLDLIAEHIANNLTLRELVEVAAKFCRRQFGSRVNAS